MSDTRWDGRPGRRPWGRAGAATAVLLCFVWLLGAFVGPAAAEDDSGPQVGVALGSHIILGNWPQGSTVRVSVDDDANLANGVLAAGDVVVTEGSWQEFATLGGQGVRSLLVPGRYVTASGGTVSKTVYVVALELGGVDPVTDTVTGTAPPGLQVSVLVFNDQDMDWSAQATANGAGQWEADLTGVHDLVLGDEGTVMYVEGDDDWTQVSWRIPKPRIYATAAADEIELVDWPPASTVHVTLDSDSDPANGVQFTQDLLMLEDGANGCDHDDLVSSGGVRTGQYVTARLGSVTKVLKIEPLTVTKADTPSNSVAGKTAPSTRVIATVYERGANEVTSSATGAWGLTFWGVDLKPGDAGQAAVVDSDGDESVARWVATGLTIKASVSSVKRGKSFTLSGRGTPAALAGASVRLEVKRPGKSWAKLTTRTIPRTGSWTYRYTVSSRATLGTYQFRVVNAAHGVLMPSVSSTAKVTVKR